MTRVNIMQLSRQYSGVEHNVLLSRIHCASTSLILSVYLAVCWEEETLTCTCIYTYIYVSYSTLYLFNILFTFILSQKNQSCMFEKKEINAYLLKKVMH